MELESSYSAAMLVPEPVSGRRSLLLVAHPGHELLVREWVVRTRPVVCVITDGSGFDARARIGRTRAWLESMAVPAGRIFGRYTDKEAYAAILSGETGWLDALVNDLTDEIVAGDISVIVADVAEGFNPVHDLCQMIAGAATALAALGGVRAAHYDYPIHAGPRSFDQSGEALVHLDLDAEALAAKMNDGMNYAEIITDIQMMIRQFGEESFRRETLHLVKDWTQWPWSRGERTLYERAGEERVAMGRYAQVVRQAEHMDTLLHHLSRRVAAMAAAPGLAVGSRP